MAIIVEVLNKQLKAVERHKFSQQQIAFGRAYDNDVILYDKHVCPHHAELVKDEHDQWLLRDLSSMNGSFIEPRRQLQQAEPLQSGQICWLGEQPLRIYQDDHQVAPAQPFNQLEQRLLKFGHGGLIFVLLCIVLLEEVFSLWLTLPQQQQMQWSRSLIDLPLLLLALCLWPAALALWAKLNQHEARFLPQLGITFAGLSLIALWQLLMTILNFSLDGAEFAVWCKEAGRIVLVVLMLAANFYLALQWSASRKLALASALGVLMSLQSIGMNVFSNDEPNLSPEFDYSLLPMSLYLNQPATADEFRQQSGLLFERTASQRSHED